MTLFLFMQMTKNLAGIVVGSRNSVSNCFEVSFSSFETGQTGLDKLSWQ